MQTQQYIIIISLLQQQRALQKQHFRNLHEMLCLEGGRRSPHSATTAATSASSCVRAFQLRLLLQGERTQTDLHSYHHRDHWSDAEISNNPKGGIPPLADFAYDLDNSLSAVYQQFISSLSAVYQQFISSLSAIYQQFISNLSISSLSAIYQQFISGFISCFATIGILFQEYSR
eukprot:scaffold17213_cov57-Attheya_sp.AAC.3